MRAVFFLMIITIIIAIVGIVASAIMSDPNPIDEQRRLEKVVESVSELQDEAENGNENAKNALEKVKRQICQQSKGKEND